MQFGLFEIAGGVFLIVYAVWMLSHFTGYVRWRAKHLHVPPSLPAAAFAVRIELWGVFGTGLLILGMGVLGLVRG